MSDSLNISNTSDYSHSLGGSHIGSSSAKSSQGDATALHQGETVRGSIVEILDKDHAKVQLPNGTFTATINGKLQEGDIILFKVQAATPQLVLKISEIPLNNEKKISIENLIRLLDLPNDALYRTLLETVQELKSSVNKDFILSIIAGYQGLTDNQKKLKSTQNLIKVLIEMKDAGFPLKTNLVEKLLPLFNTEDQIKDALIGLNQVKNDLPAPLNNRLAKLLKINEENEFEFNDMRNLFSLDLENSNSFANILIAITKNEDKNSLVMVKARAYAKLLLSTIEALSLWNVFADEHSSGTHIIMPFIISGNISVVRMIVTRNKQNPAANPEEDLQDVAFTFTTSTETMGDVATDVVAGGQHIHLSLKGENEEIKSMLEKYQSELHNLLKEGNYHLVALKFGLFSKSQGKNKSSSNHLTVVI